MRSRIGNDYRIASTALIGAESDKAIRMLVALTLLWMRVVQSAVTDNHGRHINFPPSY